MEAAGTRSGGQGAGCRVLVADDPAEVLSGRQSLIQPFYSILEHHDHFCIHFVTSNARRVRATRVFVTKTIQEAQRSRASSERRRLLGKGRSAGGKTLGQQGGRRAFAKGLELVAELPAGADRDARERHLLLALGPVLMTTHSSADPETGRVYARARQLARESAPQELTTAYTNVSDTPAGCGVARGHSLHDGQAHRSIQVRLFSFGRSVAAPTKEPFGHNARSQTSATAPGAAGSADYGKDRKW